MKKINFAAILEKLKAKRRLGATILVAVMTVLLLVLVIVGFFSIQHVRRIVVKGDSPYSDEEIISAADVEYGELLFGIDKKATEHRILAGAPYVREVKIVRIFSHLIIKVKADKAKYYITLSGKSGEYFLLSEDMRVLECRLSKEGLKESGVVYLELPELRSCRVGEFIAYGEDVRHEYVDETLAYFKSQDYGDRITAIGLSSRFDDCYFVYNGRCKVMLGRPEDLERKIEAVRKILEEHDDKTVMEYMIVNISNPGVPPTIREVSEPDF